MEHGARPRRPFHRILPEEARDWTDARMPATGPAVRIGLEDALGRVLAEPVEATRPLPPCAQAAADGYALAASDTQGASDYGPLPLELAPRGGPALSSGQAVPVSSGDPLPEGADTVLPLDGAQPFGEGIEVTGAVAPGMHVSRAGEEAQEGERVLRAGRRLRPQDLALLGALGVSRVQVIRPPRVRVLLVRPPETDACGPLLRGLVQRDGGTLQALERVADAAALQAALSRPGADLALTVGGTGEGTEDFSVAVLEQVGELGFYGVALHPGDTAAFGRAGPALVGMLPGRPLSCFWAYETLSGPLVRRLAGRDPGWPYRAVELPLTRKVASTLGRLEMCRVRIREGAAEPLAVSDGRKLASTVAADGFLPVPVQSEGYAEGTRVRVYRYDEAD